MEWYWIVIIILILAYTSKTFIVLVFINTKDMKWYEYLIVIVPFALMIYYVIDIICEKIKE